jgi:hypothetical protein
MDIRDYEVKTVKFSDSDGGTKKAVSFEYSVPRQFHIIAADGSSFYIEHSDIENIKKALDYVDLFWGVPKVKNLV